MSRSIHASRTFPVADFAGNSAPDPVEYHSKEPEVDYD
jgi:hypothetical protein